MSAVTWKPVGERGGDLEPWFGRVNKVETPHRHLHVERY